MDVEGLIRKCEPFKAFKRRYRKKYSLEAKLNNVVEKDPAVQAYIANVEARRINNGCFSGRSRSRTLSCSRDVLQYPKREINPHAITDLIAKVKQQYKQYEFSFDDRLLLEPLFPTGSPVLGDLPERNLQSK